LTVVSNRPKVFMMPVGQQHKLAFLTTDVADRTQPAVPTQMYATELNTVGDQTFHDAVNLAVQTSFNTESGSAAVEGAITTPPAPPGAPPVSLTIASSGNIDASKSQVDMTLVLKTSANAEAAQVIKAGQANTTISVPSTFSGSPTVFGGGEGSETT